MCTHKSRIGGQTSATKDSLRTGLQWWLLLCSCSHTVTSTDKASLTQTRNIWPDKRRPHMVSWMAASSFPHLPPFRSGTRSPFLHPFDLFHLHRIRSVFHRLTYDALQLLASFICLHFFLPLARSFLHKGHGAWVVVVVVVDVVSPHDVTW